VTRLLIPADAAEEEDPAQRQPAHGVPRWLGDGLPGAPLPHDLRQVRRRSVWRATSAVSEKQVASAVVNAVISNAVLSFDESFYLMDFVF